MATTDIDVRELEQRGIDVIRGLSMDAVQRANSGHPGTPMALAPLAHVLFTRIMKYDATAPDWPDLALVAPARAYPARHGAMLLPWKAAAAALSSAAPAG